MTVPTPPPAGQPPVPPATPKPKRRWWIPLVAGAAVLFLCCVGSVVAFSGDDDTEPGRPSAVDTTDRDDNRAASRNDTADGEADADDADRGDGDEADGGDEGGEPEPAPEPDSFGAGTWEVGAEIPAGTYVTVAPDGRFAHCYWARLSGFSGGFDEIIANDNLDPGARGRVTIDSGDVGIEFTGGCRWVEESEAPSVDVGSEYGPGVWRVGDEIAPGTYVTTASDGALDHCYWARLSGFSGTFDDIITNDLIEPGSRGRVEISSSDTGITFTGACTWTRN